jgi:RimJ/RimL family protein N-acetyltransferase
MSAASDSLQNEVIRTERLLLRRTHPSDTEAIRAQIADWEVMRWLSQPPWPYTLQDAVAFIELCSGQDPTVAAHAITRGDGEALMGVISLRINRPGLPQRPRWPVLGYWLGRAHWGHGYTTEAARGLLGSAFSAGVGDTIYSIALADNAASLRVQEKLGFERDGETMAYSRGHGREALHVTTRLSRSAFRTA